MYMNMLLNMNMTLNMNITLNKPKTNQEQTGNKPRTNQKNKRWTRIWEQTMNKLKEQTVNKPREQTGNTHKRTKNDHGYGNKPWINIVLDCDNNATLLRMTFNLILNWIISLVLREAAGRPPGGRRKICLTVAKRPHRGEKPSVFRGLACGKKPVDRRVEAVG